MYICKYMCIYAHVPWQFEGCYMCVCVCVCMCVCVCVNIWLHVYTKMNVNMQWMRCSYAPWQVEGCYVYIYVCVHMNICCICVCENICVHVDVPLDQSRVAMYISARVCTYEYVYCKYMCICGKCCWCPWPVQGCQIYSNTRVCRYMFIHTYILV